MNAVGWAMQPLGSGQISGEAGPRLQVKVKISSSARSTSVKNLRADPFAFVFALGRSAFINACVSD